MIMSTPVLAMYLDGPLQSWGYQSRFDRRTSLSYPTRSGILGMLCAALAIDWRDTCGLERLESGISLSVYTFGQPSMLVDYHTVGGGYDNRCDPQCLVRAADGKAGKDPVQTYREYLQEARFGALLGGDRELLDKIAAALADPAWGIWLGRKSCIAATPVLQGLFDSDTAALAHLEALAGSRCTRKVTEITSFADGTDTLLDRPVDFAGRGFRPRRVVNEVL
jgi:CRISPR system Cascade subunit CasD